MNGPVTDSAAVSSYQARASAVPWVVLSWTPATVLLVLVAIIGVGSLAGKLFAVLLAGASVWTIFIAVSAAWRLELTADTFRWRTTFHEGEVPLTELKSIRSARGEGRTPSFGPAAWRARSFAVIEFTTGRKPVNIAIRDGLALFAESVKRAAPALDVDLGETSSGYRRES